jgi:hypothetical protein
MLGYGDSVGRDIRFSLNTMVRGPRNPTYKDSESRKDLQGTLLYFQRKWRRAGDEVFFRSRRCKDGFPEPP